MATQPQALSVSIPIGAYDITRTAVGDEIRLDGFGRLPTAGKPRLPSRIFAVAIPPGAVAIEVACDAGDGVVLPGVYDVPPTPLARVIGPEDPAAYERDRRQYEANYQAVYGSDDPCPRQVVEFVRQAGYRGYNLVDVRVTPFVYRPLSGQLTYYPEITVHVSYRPVAGRDAAAMSDGSPSIARTAREIILNHDALPAEYPQVRAAGRGLHDFVIITQPSLIFAVTPLVEWETAKGRTVEVVTTTWIDANYTGYDLAEKMRNFLRDKYPADQWGIEDVLLVGDYDDVPMRRTAQCDLTGCPETDFYYAELSLPDDQSWDADGDHLYGEDTDPIDLYAEVNVGRIPSSDYGTVWSICQRSVAYEQNNDPAFKRNILLLGAFFWDDDPYPRTDNAVLMEAKVNQPWMADWSLTRIYEEDYSTYPLDYNLSRSTVVSVWSAGTFGFVNWAGHGSPTSTHVYHGGMPSFIESGDCSELNDAYPAIVFADSCSNSDTDYLNIGQEMIQQGAAVGFVGATKVAYGMPAWDEPSDGSSQSLDYYFTTCVTSGEYTQGQALQWSLRKMYTDGLWDYDYYETFEWAALWGNPDLGMGRTVPLIIGLPDGWPQYLAPGAYTAFTVEILDGRESYVPGTGTLHYRYDGDAFVTAPFTPLGNNLYQATLPAASCADAPEFYVSAGGDGGSTVTSPADAPAEVYAAAVGTPVPLFADDFETDQGWTVSGDATDGHWERGVPADGDRGDPPADYDGSGQCYVTDNVAGNSDVDGGATILTSPPIDMSGGATVTYAYWLNDIPTGAMGPEDSLTVQMATDADGTDWQTLRVYDTAAAAWRTDSIEVGAEIVASPTMRIRFLAIDGDPGDVIEAGVDAVEVTAVSCADPIPGDFDGDGDVDLDDSALFVDCLGGPGNPPAPCTLGLTADLDTDGHVDVGDFAILAQNFTGSE